LHAKIQIETIKTLDNHWSNFSNFDVVRSELIVHTHPAKITVCEVLTVLNGVCGVMPNQHAILLV
jgi:hypothetical protein